MTGEPIMREQVGGSIHTWKAPSKCLSCSLLVFPGRAVDGDPHFVVDFPLSKLTVCFNIDGQPGDILRLVSDHADSGKFHAPCDLRARAR